MAIRAVDMAMPVQRATEMTQNQRGETRPEMQHQQFAERLNRETTQKAQSVQQPNESEEAQIQKDGRGNSGGYSGNSKKRDKKDQKAPGTAKKSSTSMFDITV